MLLTCLPSLEYPPENCSLRMKATNFSLKPLSILKALYLEVSSFQHLILFATNKELLTSFCRSRKVRFMGIRHLLGFFQLPPPCLVEYISTDSEPLWNGNRIKPHRERAQDQKTLSPSKIYVKTLLNLSISGSKTSTLVLAVHLKRFAFLEQPGLLRSSKKELSGLWAMWYHPGLSPHL